MRTYDSHPTLIKPDYNPIPREVEKTMIADLLAQNNEVETSDSRYVVLNLGNRSPYANLARALECKIFNLRFGNDPAEMESEYGSYEEASTFFLHIDREKLKTGGVMRMIKPNPAGLKSSNDIVTAKCGLPNGTKASSLLEPAEVYAEFNAEPEFTLDNATMAVDYEYSNKRNPMAMTRPSMFRAIYQYSIANGYKDVFVISDRVPLQKVGETGLPINTSPKIADSFTYLGAPDNTFIHIPILLTEQVVRERNPAVHQFMFSPQDPAGFKLSLIEQ